jgi:integrase
VATGARASNVFRLRWEDVDLEAKVFRVSAAEFKGRRAVGFPLPPDAVTVLEQQRGAHPEYVFTDQLGRAPVRSLKTCWAKACKRAGLPGLRLHDLRHTFAAWHKLAGTPAHALKELGGWSDIRLVDRYGHINPQDYAQFADNRRTRKGTGSSGNDGK